MESRLILNAAAHRLWYVDGDVVKVRVSLSCVPEGVTGAKRDVVPLQAIPTQNYFSVDTAESEPREMDVRVQTLTAELVGRVELDASVMKVISWPGATSSSQPTPSRRPGSANSKVLYVLYSTGKKPLLDDVGMRRYQCTALEFLFRLPEGCPPTCSGKGADYRHVVTIAASWQNARAGSAKGSLPHTCKVRIPLLVFSSVASIAQLPLMSLFPLPRDSTLVKEDFHFQVMPLPAVPTPSVAAPLQDVIFPQDGQLRTSLTVRRLAKNNMQNTLAAQRQPLKLLMPCNGVNILQVHLHSSCVALGGFLNGSFIVCDGGAANNGVRANRKRDMEAPVPVNVTASLELLECVTPEWALTTDEDSMRDTKAQGIDNFVCLHKRVIDHAHFTVVDTPSVPFEFSLPIGLVPATTITDVTTFLWQLRVVVTTVARKSLAKMASPGVDRLGPLLEPVAGVFPLLIAPPAMPTRGRQGAAW
ncbi:hypothetical protein ABB37_03571 [Leptomonas pyrrhocoris]|uniref:Uncharacterized protein n=1 Tax=Leptomonas pyrrhocoris TaxID=157538 RepID=A0A0N0VG85_LEPPY|nr:hypothetical protein ABB37_03571 [Leptomonas pyrrhocoris]KPA82524.1 hypothetical protein ABB37_03571 [Leptomonas pyrrhocoris]|eukprot:XP_015660963.1 hypothetical protein ABB37_03571 [Leptomonas pyrrhocoris]